MNSNSRSMFKWNQSQKSNNPCSKESITVTDFAQTMQHSKERRFSPIDEKYNQISLLKVFNQYSDIQVITSGVELFNDFHHEYILMPVKLYTDLQKSCRFNSQCLAEQDKEITNLRARVSRVHRASSRNRFT